MSQDAHVARFDGETIPAREGVALPDAQAQANGDLIDGRYRLLCELGHGGMGVVHLAEDGRLKRRVAIKFLRARATDTDVQRFRHEAQLLASLSHPNVVKVFDFGDHHGRPYFVMEHLDGSTLADLLAGSPEGLPVDVAIGFGRQLCDALHAVHLQGIIHRDIKPGNVIVTRGTLVTLMDFGLARLDGVAREGGMVSGTPQYLPPEDIRGQPLTGQEARRSDIYALGVTLYELIAGRPPFSHENTTVVLHQQVFDAPPPLSDVRPDVPAVFERVIMRALEKDPMLRQGNCADVIAELQDARLEMTLGHEAARNGTMDGLAPAPSSKPPPQRSPAPAPRTVSATAIPVVALIANGGPMRERLAEQLREHLGACEVAVLPMQGLTIGASLVKLKPSCVVLDLDLLEESPYELCASLRASPETAALPIVAVGDEVSGAEGALLARMGIRDPLPRPLDPQQLAARLAGELHIHVA